MKNVLIVCAGNICRSPMAEALLKQYSAQQHWGLNISSAGLCAVKSVQPTSFACQVMRERELDISQHMPHQLTTSQLQQAELILVMEKWQQHELGYISPSAYGKVHLLGKWGAFDVPDPYRKSIATYEQTFCLIEKGLQEWIKRIWMLHV